MSTEMTNFQKLARVLAQSELDEMYQLAVMTSVSHVATSEMPIGFGEKLWEALRSDYVKPPVPAKSSDLFVGLKLDDDWKDFAHCLKTGCGMVYRGRWYWGDLHEDRNTKGNTFYFNATSEIGTLSGELACPLSACMFTVASDAFVLRTGKVFILEEGSFTYNEAFEKFNAEWNK